MESYSIGEVCRLLNVKPHVLRYWEQEFSLLSPRKDFNGQRKYTSNDLNTLYRIRHLLYEEKYTIEGARNRIWKDVSSGNADLRAAINSMRQSLVSLSLKVEKSSES